MANIKDPYHIDGQLHVSGRTKFLLEHPLPAGTLFMAIKHSPVAHGEIININTEAALKIPGVSGVYTYKDRFAINETFCQLPVSHCELMSMPSHPGE